MLKYNLQLAAMEQSAVATEGKNFDAWFAKILRDLYDNDDAGYVRAMIAFPLLERYVRLKVQWFGVSLDDRCYEEIARLIPELKDGKQAKKFWETYRHSLFHRLTSKGWLRKLESPVLFSNGDFHLDSVKFAKRVLEIIENDFAIFERERPGYALPKEGLYETIPPTNDMGIGARTQIVTGTVQPSLPNTWITEK